MTKQELIEKLGLSDKEIEALKVIVQEEIDDAMQCIEDRLPDIIALEDDEDWDLADNFAAILVKEFIAEWRTEE